MAAQQDAEQQPSGPGRAAQLKRRACERADGVMLRAGLAQPRQRQLAWHYLNTLWEQILAIVPISILQASRCVLCAHDGACADPSCWPQLRLQTRAASAPTPAC